VEPGALGTVLEFSTWGHSVLVLWEPTPGRRAFNYEGRIWVHPDDIELAPMGDVGA